MMLFSATPINADYCENNSVSHFLLFFCFLFCFVLFPKEAQLILRQRKRNWAKIFFLFFTGDVKSKLLNQSWPPYALMCWDYNRRHDSSVYQQRRETGLLICLNEPLHCPMAFCNLNEMLRVFQKHGPWTNHDAHAHCRAKNSWNCHMRAHTAGHWRHRLAWRAGTVYPFQFTPFL